MRKRGQIGQQRAAHAKEGTAPPPANCARERGAHRDGVPLFRVGVRRCPTLPHPGGCSTIGAGGLSFRVRNGAGRFPSAMAAVTGSNLSQYDPPGGGCLGGPRTRGPGWVVREPYSGRTRFWWLCCVLSCWPLVPVSSTPCGASTSGLSTQWSAGGLQHQWCMETSS